MPNRMHEGGSIAAFFLLLVTLQGCQSLPDRPVNTDVALNVPFFPQTEYQCGPAALASMLGWAGKPVSPDALVEEVWLPGRRGSLATELMAAARARGLLVYRLDDFEDIRRELDAGHPVLMQQNLLFSWWPKWHFAVITGYGEDGDMFIQHSAQNPSQAVPADWLRARWTPEAVLFVAVTPDSLPATATPEKLAASIANVSRSSNTDALAFWHAATQRFANSALLQFGYANALNRRGELPQAAQHYLHAVAADKHMAASWNNLADTLIRLGCPQPATLAISQALAQQPDSTTYQQTLQEVPLNAAGDQCHKWTETISAQVNN